MRKLTHDEIARRRLTKDDIRSAQRLPIYTMLDNIRSLYNVGSMFRTSDGALISKIYLTGYTPKPPRKEIEKTALGATETVPWEYIRNPLDAIHELKNKNIRICVLEHTTNSIPTHHVTSHDFPLCLVVGNEIAGISSDIIAAADMAVEIPMFGTKQSLNAAVAYGIALFDFVRILNST
jgi:tRNA G18 (ribose-2'-O)-methylase SpoU